MTYIENKLEEITKIFPKFEDFYTFELQNKTENTQKSYLNGLVKIFSILQKYDATKYTKKDIGDLISHEEFKNLKNKSKNYYLLFLKKYLKHYNTKERYKELLESIPKYRPKLKELNKNELISREELDLILQNVSTRKKAMIMVLYEGALRRGELKGIKFKDVQFDEDFINLFVRKSKTKGRNIPLIESIPYLKEYFSQNTFKPDDEIFGYHEQYITDLFKILTLKLKKKYNGKNKTYKWTKELHPHLFRHSRLTELAGTQLNEPQLRKFAGWSADSDMPKIYFHLDDSDLRNVMLQRNGRKEYKKPELEAFKPIICANCKTENPQQNVFCSKCGKVINKDRVVVERLQEQEDIEQLKTSLTETNQKLNNMGHLVKILANIVKEIGTKKIPLEEVLPNDIDHYIPETAEFEVDDGGEELSEFFTEQADKILKKE